MEKNHIHHNSFYIGETGRQLNTRIGEHKKSVRLEGISSAVGEHQMDTGHSIAWNEVSVLGIEPKDYPRKIREAIEIRAHHPSLNHDRSLGHKKQLDITNTSEGAGGQSAETSGGGGEREEGATTVTSGGQRS